MIAIGRVFGNASKIIIIIEHKVDLLSPSGGYYLPKKEGFSQPYGTGCITYQFSGSPSNGCSGNDGCSSGKSGSSSGT